MSNQKRGIIVGAILALLSLILTAQILWHYAGANNPVGKILIPFLSPGTLLLRPFMSGWSMAHGGFFGLYLTVPLAYFIIGFIIGSASRNFSLAAGISVVLICGGTGAAYWQNVRAPAAKREMAFKQQAEAHSRALESNPNDVNALHGLAHYSMRIGDLSAADKHLRRVVELDFKNGAYSTYGRHALLYLASVNQRLGKDVEAEVWYQKFLEIKPDLSRQTGDLVELNLSNEYVKKKEKRGHSVAR